MRISDWSSDVCSSDLPGIGGGTMMGPSPAPLPGFYQFTYITNDFDRAIKLLCDVHGMDHFLEIRPLQVALAEAQPARMNCALGYVGAMEIEVMNPIDGAVDRSEEHTSELQSLM